MRFSEKINIAGKRCIWKVWTRIVRLFRLCGYIFPFWLWMVNPPNNGEFSLKQYSTLILPHPSPLLLPISLIDSVETTFQVEASSVSLSLSFVLSWILFPVDWRWIYHNIAKNMSATTMMVCFSSSSSSIIKFILNSIQFFQNKHFAHFKGENCK